MKNELFIKRLRELAEVKPRKAPRSAGVRESSEPEPIFRAGQEFVITKDNNPTFTWEIVKLNPIVKDCEDCGQEGVTDRVVQKKIATYPVHHWRETCNNCRMCRNPATGKFDIPTTQINAFFIGYLSSKK